MASSPAFRLRQYVRADLQRQWLLMQAGDEMPPSGVKVWLGVFAPRFLPVLLCRLAHSLYLCRLSPVAKFISLLNVLLFGIEISVRCHIGPGLVLPHTHGTVIGAGGIGANVTIFQGVTLGARELDFRYVNELRPIVGNDVTIGAGAKVLGGIEIGNGVRIGANAVVLKSVPDGALVVGVPARIVESGQSQL